MQYYQDDAGNIFYYAADGQPVYYNQTTGEYTTTPPSTTTAASTLPPTTSTASSTDDVSTLQQKVAEYERYIATLQSSLVSSNASPLPAISSLSSELDLSRTDNERLQAQLRQLQGRLEQQSKSMSELMEDNATLVHEYEEVCVQLQSAEQDKQETWLRQRDEDTALTAREDGRRVSGGDSEVMQQVADNSARVQRELVEGMQLTDTIRSQWQRVLQLIQHAHEQSVASSKSDASTSDTAVVRVNGMDGGKADWLTVLQQAEALSSLLSQKSDHDHQVRTALMQQRTTRRSASRCCRVCLSLSSSLFFAVSCVPAVHAPRSHSTAARPAVSRTVAFPFQHFRYLTTTVDAGLLLIAFFDYLFVC